MHPAGPEGRPPGPKNGGSSVSKLTTERRAGNIVRHWAMLTSPSVRGAPKDEC